VSFVPKLRLLPSPVLTGGLQTVGNALNNGELATRPGEVSPEVPGEIFSSKRRRTEGAQGTKLKIIQLKYWGTPLSTNGNTIFDPAGTTKNGVGGVLVLDTLGFWTVSIS